MMGMMWLIWILVAVLLVLLIIGVIRWLRRGDAMSSDSAARPQQTDKRERH